MASAGFGVGRGSLPLPILPRNQTARYHDSCPEGCKQCDDHRDHRGEVSVIEIHPISYAQTGYRSVPAFKIDESKTTNLKNG
jgi:hypothetical protein